MAFTPIISPTLPPTQKHVFGRLFNCFKQSLTWLYHPSIHPSRTILFCTKKERMPKYCINLLLFCANHKTDENCFLINLKCPTSNFTAQRKCLEFSTENLQFFLNFFNFLKLQKFNIFYKIDPPPLKFNLNVIRSLNFKNWAIFG